MSVQVRSLSHRCRISAAPWTPASPTPGGYLPAHWYRSDQGLWQDAGATPATNDGDPVGRWEDLTANADHVDQATAANKPTLQNGAADLLNGHPVIRADGVNDYLYLSSFTNGGLMTQPNTVFIVATLNTIVQNTASSFLAGVQVGARPYIIQTYTTGVPDPWATWAGAWLTGSPASTGWNVWTILHNGASSQFWKNGISQGAGNAGLEDLNGLYIFSNNSANLADADTTEIILYNAALPDAAKNQVGQYLADRYGLNYTEI